MCQDGEKPLPASWMIEAKGRQNREAHAAEVKARMERAKLDECVSAWVGGLAVVTQPVSRWMGGEGGKGPRDPVRTREVSGPDGA